MVELRPFPIGALAQRMLREFERDASIFHLPASKFYRGNAEHDLGVNFHGARASTPLGPAAGPQSQMAQNIVLSWLCGCRILELKTVQINDRLQIPRPCIDAQTVGYNVEWSQELRLQESLDEYVKGALLIEALRSDPAFGLGGVPGETIFDMSVGYDLEGIRSKPVRAFLDGMLDCRATVDRLRPELPESMRDVTIGPCLSNTLTLSTFHGCPPSEIESICEWLLEELGLHVIVKLNPLLLGPKDLRQRLHTDLGYRDLSVPDKAFEEDTRWEQMEGFVQRLGQRADRLGLGFGVKFTNTLVVQNQRDFFPATEETMYLSGQPLHVLAMELVGRFRERFEDRYPISFSAGIDRRNFADSVALGLTPVTVCTDLLRPGGYARGKGYLDELEGRMSKVGARNIDEFVLLARGQGEQTLSSVTPMSHAADQVQCEQFLATTRADGEGKDQEGALPRGDSLNAWRSAAVLQNTRDYVHELIQDPRYHQDANLKLPRKIGSQLELLDCITCDKCVPVCPNDANFTFVLEPASIPKRKATLENGQWTITVDGTLEIEQRHQIACFTDFCNECGNCDVFCPEDGGPYKIKPRFFGDIEELRQNPTLDGFCYERLAGIDRLQARIGGRDFILKRGASRIEFMGVKFSIHFDEGRLQETIEGKAAESIDLVYYDLLALILDAVCGPDSHEYPALHARAGSESSE